MMLKIIFAVIAQHWLCEGEPECVPTTKHFIVHLKSRHPHHYNTFLTMKKDKEKQQVPAGTKTHQQLLLESLDEARKYNLDYPRH